MLALGLRSPSRGKRLGLRSSSGRNRKLPQSRNTSHPDRRGFPPAIRRQDKAHAEFWRYVYQGVRGRIDRLRSVRRRDGSVLAWLLEQRLLETGRRCRGPLTPDLERLAALYTSRAALRVVHDRERQVLLARRRGRSDRRRCSGRRAGSTYSLQASGRELCAGVGRSTDRILRQADGRRRFTSTSSTDRRSSHRLPCISPTRSSTRSRAQVSVAARPATILRPRRRARSSTARWDSNGSSTWPGPWRFPPSRSMAGRCGTRRPHSPT